MWFRTGFTLCFFSWSNRCLERIHKYIKGHWMHDAQLCSISNRYFVWNYTVRGCYCGFNWLLFSNPDRARSIDSCDVRVCDWFNWLYSGSTIATGSDHSWFNEFHDSKSETTLSVVVVWFWHWSSSATIIVWRWLILTEVFLLIHNCQLTHTISSSTFQSISITSPSNMVLSFPLMWLSVDVSVVIFLFSYFHDSVHFLFHQVHNCTECKVTLFHYSVTKHILSINCFFLLSISKLSYGAFPDNTGAIIDKFQKITPRNLSSARNWKNWLQPVLVQQFDRDAFFEKPTTTY